MIVPTPENINALPDGLRSYIHALLTLALENKTLKKRIVELEEELAAWEETH